LTVMTATGLRLTATVHVIPRVPFSPDTLRWTPRSPFPSGPVGVGVAAAEVPAGDLVATTLYSAGGSELVGSRLVPDSGVLVAGAAAVVRRGRIYVLGGADSVGHPQRSVFVGRVGLDGHIDGWYRQPLLTSARAYGGGVVLDDRAIAFGGVADSVPPGGGLDAATTRLASSDTAPVSLVSGFFAGPWAPGIAL